MVDPSSHKPNLIHCSFAIFFLAISFTCFVLRARPPYCLDFTAWMIRYSLPWIHLGGELFGCVWFDILLDWKSMRQRWDYVLTNSCHNVEQNTCQNASWECIGFWSDLFVESRRGLWTKNCSIGWGRRALTVELGWRRDCCNCLHFFDNHFRQFAVLQFCWWMSWNW